MVGLFEGYNFFYRIIQTHPEPQTKRGAYQNLRPNLGEFWVFVRNLMDMIIFISCSEASESLIKESQIEFESANLKLFKEAIRKGEW